MVAHNTLVASDYGLLDEKTLAPKPNYWGALLWRKLMGSTVLDPGPAREGFHLYAHSLRNHPGGVALLVINTSRSQKQSFDLPTPAERYTLTAPKLQGKEVQLNGRELKLQANDELPKLAGESIPSGGVEFEPTSITFLAVRDAGNPSSR